jgi:2-oxoglutarate ferredoxin oxidoreductase subunit alpha
MQARWGTHGDHPIITISPSSVQEAYNETIRAFNLSERLGVPVILLMDEIVGHMREGVDLQNADELVVLDRLTEDDPVQAGIPYDVAPGSLRRA